MPDNLEQKLSNYLLGENISNTYQVTKAINWIKDNYNLIPKESMAARNYNPSFGELIDILSIRQQKEIFIPEKREVYTKQIQEIVSDLTNICKDKNVLMTGELIQAIISLTQTNTWIWSNEDACRSGTEGENDLTLTHSLNTLRTQIYSLISQMVGDRAEYKANTSLPHPNWIPSFLNKEK